jgi:16S rRNA (adenine1518-N6/adenine1519-N6)-dimethyltransferase
LNESHLQKTIIGPVDDVGAMDVSELKRRIRDLGITPNKRLGQHFLIDEAVANRQVQYAKVGKNDTVLEIGPGLGILTGILSTRAKRVVAVEADPAAADYIERTFGDVEIIRGDVLKIDLPEFDKVVSNLPFNISSSISFRLLERSFDSGILMYQKEFAERLVASEGSKDYSRLSVNAYYRARSEVLETVPRSLFYPEPKVDASIVRLEPRRPPFEVADEDHFFEVVRALFTHRRKQIRNSLVLEWMNLTDTKESMAKFVSGLPGSDRRVEDLSPEEIGGLSNRIIEEKFNLPKGHHSTPSSAQDKDR